MTKDFKRLRELEAKRTQGEWEWSSHGDPVVFDLEEPSFGYLYPKGSEDGPYSIIQTDCNVYGPNAIDAQWIAECSIQVPNLLKRIDELEAEKEARYLGLTSTKTVSREDLEKLYPTYDEKLTRINELEIRLEELEKENERLRGNHKELPPYVSCDKTTLDEIKEEFSDKP